MDDVNIGHFTTEYAYDALGRRIEIRHADGPATRYVYDGSRVAEEWAVSSGGGASLSASYVYGNYIDEVLTMRRGTTDYYYHGDDQHNVVKLTDNTGAVVETYDYGDYGQPEFYDASGALLDVSESPFGNPYLFTGRRWDEELGYYYFRNRYMDPALGRFVSRDPIGLWGDAANLGNGYTYAASNPWSLVDPFGLFSGGNIETAAFLQGFSTGEDMIGENVLSPELFSDKQYQDFYNAPADIVSLALTGRVDPTYEEFRAAETALLQAAAPKISARQNLGTLTVSGGHEFDTGENVVDVGVNITPSFSTSLTASGYSPLLDFSHIDLFGAGPNSSLSYTLGINTGRGIGFRISSNGRLGVAATTSSAGFNLRINAVSF